MDENSNKLVSAPAISPDLSLFTERERGVLEKAEKEGIRPISPTLAAQMFELYLEGYSCEQIAKVNAPIREGEILFLRKKYQWDENKDNYCFNLQSQMRDKLMKQKLESLEFLTNMLAVTHKEHKEKSLRYLQTGKEEDKQIS